MYTHIILHGIEAYIQYLYLWFGIYE